MYQIIFNISYNLLKLSSLFKSKDKKILFMYNILS